MAYQWSEDLPPEALTLHVRCEQRNRQRGSVTGTADEKRDMWQFYFLVGLCDGAYGLCSRWVLCSLFALTQRRHIRDARPSRCLRVAAYKDAGVSRKRASRA